MLPPIKFIERVQVVGSTHPDPAYSFTNVYEVQIQAEPYENALALVTLEEEKPKKQYVQLRVSGGGESK